MTASRPTPRTWHAQWIGTGAALGSWYNAPLPAPLLRRAFTVGGEVAQATLYICGLGYFVARLNGQRVGDHVLDPVVSQYDQRVRYVTHDVTALLANGENAIGVTLGNGWYNCHTPEVWHFDKASWRDYPKLIAELEITLASGETLRIASDTSWRVGEGPLRFDGLRNGETYDAREERTGWDSAGYDDSTWRQAAIVPGPGGLLEPQTATPCRVTETLKPVSLTTLASGAVIYDIGQNMAGWVQLHVAGEAGTEVTLTYAEKLGADGDLDMSNIDSFIKGGDCQTDRYTLSGAGDEVWEPSFVYHGFQYVRVTGLPGEATLDTLRGRVVHTDFAAVGEVACSDETLNRLQRCTLWAYRGNFVGIPTDCPHREKNGWTGDAQLAVETGLWNYDATSAYAEWIDTMVDCQRPSGQLPGIVPSTGWGYNWGSGPAWDSALIMIPWAIYVYTGDRALIDRHYPAMALYVDYLGSLATDDIVSFGLGDWCTVDMKDMAPASLTSTAYYYADTRLVARFAEMTGRADDAATYHELADRIRVAFNKTFYKGDGLYADGKMTSLACAVYQGLVEDSERAAVVARLAAAVEANDCKVDFGILGAKYVPRVLAEHGHADLAYRLFTQPEFPGWAHWLADGATTLRENWDNSASQNHIMFGDIGACLYQYFAGIVPDPAHPGFDRITLRPQVIDSLEWIRASHRIPAGTIRSAWQRDGETVTFHIELPPDSVGSLEVAGHPSIALSGGKCRHTLTM